MVKVQSISPYVINRLNIEPFVLSKAEIEKIKFPRTRHFRCKILKVDKNNRFV